MENELAARQKIKHVDIRKSDWNKEKIIVIMKDKYSHWSGWSMTEGDITRRHVSQNNFG